MKSAAQLYKTPAGAPLLADDVLEFHAARLVLLFSICGVSGKIDGLTKMAKLDFFVRYPRFFSEVCATLGVKASVDPEVVESAMVRHHYGPWDGRYYQVLAFLEGRGLLDVRQDGKTFCLQLTETGRQIAKTLRQQPAFSEVCEQMKRVKEVLGKKKGNWIKDLIYKTFREEIANRPLGETIEKR